MGRCMASPQIPSQSKQLSGYSSGLKESAAAFPSSVVQKCYLYHRQSSISLYILNLKKMWKLEFKWWGSYKYYVYIMLMICTNAFVSKYTVCLHVKLVWITFVGPLCPLRGGQWLLPWLLVHSLQDCLKSMAMAD